MGVLMLTEKDLARLLTLHAVHGGSNNYMAAESRRALESAGLVSIENTDDYDKCHVATVTPEGRRVIGVMLAAARTVTDA